MQDLESKMYRNILKPVPLVLWAAMMAFAALLGWAMVNHSLPGFDAIFAQPWFVVTIADFYLGVLCFGGVMLAFEKSPFTALAWFGSLCFLGNIVAVLWFTLRLPQLIGAR